MPRLIPSMDTGAISGTLLNLFVVLVVIGFLLTVSFGGFLVWALAALVFVLVLYGMAARLYYRWIGRR